MRYFETIRTESHLYLVLEYVENGSLATLIKNFGAFPEHLVCVYVRQVLRGLEWLHEQGDTWSAIAHEARYIRRSMGGGREEDMATPFGRHHNLAGALER